MKLLFYDVRDLAPALKGTRSVFLAGPTVPQPGITAWRADAVRLFEQAGFEGALVIPEFEVRHYKEAAPTHFGRPPSPVAGMKDHSYNVLAWETLGIEQSSHVMFWMPFSIGEEHDPDSMPGFTTRAEVARELVRAPRRITLGMTPDALSSAHIRYHAHHAGVSIHPTLEATVAAVLKKF
jgi:hypothetical protein